MVSIELSILKLMQNIGMKALEVQTLLRNELNIEDDKEIDLNIKKLMDEYYPKAVEQIKAQYPEFK